jgi:hypothetical protein
MDNRETVFYGRYNQKINTFNASSTSLVMDQKTKIKPLTIEDSLAILKTVNDIKSILHFDVTKSDAKDYYYKVALFKQGYNPEIDDSYDSFMRFLYENGENENLKRLL